MNTYWEQWVIPEKLQVKPVTGVVEVGHGISKGWRTWKLEGSIKKEMEFSQECSRKTNVELLGGDQKNISLFGLVCIIHLRAPKIFFKFPKIFGTEEWTYLNSQSQLYSMCQFFKMHLWQHRVSMFLESIIFSLEWWIKWEMCNVLYQLVLVA